MGSRRFTSLAASWGLFAIGALMSVEIGMLFVSSPPGRPVARALWAFLFPLALMVGSAIVLYKQYRALRRERRRSEGRCVHGGYSPRGNLPGVCPEADTRAAALPDLV